MNAEAEDFPHCCTSCGHEDGKKRGEERAIAGGEGYGRSNDGIVAVIDPYAVINLLRHCRRAADSTNNEEQEGQKEDNNDDDGANGDSSTESDLSQVARFDTYRNT